MPNTTFKLNVFDGPLDLLLFLIKKNDVNIYDIPVAEITKQFLDILRSAETVDLDETAEFHAMAANLLLIKSRTLLPIEIAIEDEEDPRRELVERLIEYQRFKKLSELMEKKVKETELVIERKRAQRDLPFTNAELWQKMDVWDLFKTFSHLMSDIATEQVIDLYEEVSINEKITLLTEILGEKGECTFSELVTRKNSVMDVICAFLGMLEAAKTRTIQISQDVVFGEVTIKSRNAHGEEG
ncbi:MAG: segregation/condensation protein A [Treponema sp.]|jgi:segregation and condensation protein A|nr:segregation/condensation protein A [Treponema sp.]